MIEIKPGGQKTLKLIQRFANADAAEQGVMTSLKNKDEVKAFFEDLLTREEKLMLGKRFQIAMMHKLGYFWGEINERVKVTNDTVAKIRQKLDFGLNGLNKVAERIIATTISISIMF